MVVSTSCNFLQRVISIFLDLFNSLHQRFDFILNQIFQSLNSPEVRDQFINLLGQNMSADAHFCSLAVGNYYSRCFPNSFFGNPEKTGFQLGGNKTFVLGIDYHIKQKRLQIRIGFQC